MAATTGSTDVMPTTARIHSTRAGMTITVEIQAKALIVAATGLGRRGKVILLKRPALDSAIYSRAASKV